MLKNFGVEVYKGGVIVVNAQYRAACSTGDVSGIRMFNFERKCAGGLPGQFAGTFAGHYICLEHLIVVILLHATLIRLSLSLHRLVLRGEPDYLSVLSMPFALLRTYNVLPRE